MPRRLRIHVPGGTYYVVRRTHSCHPVFAQPEDYLLFESLLPAALKRTGTQLLGYCWMPDAVHLALQIETVPVGDFMRELASRYARQVQIRTGQRGQFFRRPYQATLIDPASYLPMLIRYLHHIPAMEGLTQHPGDYPHSSHRAYMGSVHHPWLNTRPFLQLIDCLDGNRFAYRHLLSETPPAKLRFLLERGHEETPGVLGDEGFLAALPRRGRSARSTRSLEDIAEHVARIHGVQRIQLLSRSRRHELVLARAQIAWYATERRVATLCEVARYLRRSASSLTRAITRHQRCEPERFTFEAFTSFVPLVPLTSTSHFGLRGDGATRVAGTSDILHGGEVRRDAKAVRQQAW